MIKISIIGNFGSPGNSFDGQTVKTRIVTEELRRVLGDAAVTTFNTVGGIRTLLKAPLMTWRALRQGTDVVILPAHNAVRVLVPLLVLLQGVFPHRRVHYVVIGGWLPSFLKSRPILRWFLHRVHRIYAETHRMENDLKAMGFVHNVVYMPNCKPLPIVDEADLKTTYTEPYRLCTFSRVWSEKGIGDAVEAVKAVNEKLGRAVYALDIYGKVEKGEEQWWADLMSRFPDYVHYGGVVAFDKSVEVLKDYFALLFPTRCYTEGIPGTIIDAYAAGLPVVSSLYLNFDEIIDDGITGVGYPFGHNESLMALLEDIAVHPQRIISLKTNCVHKAAAFQPKEAVGVLAEEIRKRS